MTWFLDTALVAGAWGAVSGACVPAVIASIPEPAPEPEPSLTPAADEAAFARPVDEPKQPYVEVAGLPGLRWKAALASAVAAALIGGRLGWDPALLFLLYLVPVCVALSVVDWRTRYLPTRLVAPSYAAVAALTVLASALSSDWGSLLGAAAGWAGTFLVFTLLWWLPGGLGYGDVRLAGVLGMALGWLGVAELVLGIYTGFVLGGLAGLVLSGLRIFHHRHTPFGPHLVVGALLGAAFPAQLAAAYGWVVEALVSLVSR
ncbi:MAG TPA: A24 family peptidase [Nocardioidaceae bacterium]|nr:A24 family peptidase [Nocardioidaceae bacterium]